MSAFGAAFAAPNPPRRCEAADGRIPRDEARILAIAVIGAAHR